jgi:hypothetical protein
VSNACGYSRSNIASLSARSRSLLCADEACVQQRQAAGMMLLGMLAQQQQAALSRSPCSYCRTEQREGDVAAQSGNWSRGWTAATSLTRSSRPSVAFRKVL